MVVMRFGETPVPIPNTTVKPKTAESTALETVWEGRWPHFKKKRRNRAGNRRRPLRYSFI